MFKIASEPTFTHEVKVRVPVDGGHRTDTFKATFRVIDPVEIDAFDLMDTISSTEFLKRIVVRLEEIADAQGRPLEWSDEVRDSVLRLPWARKGLAKTYFAAVSEAREGN